MISAGELVVAALAAGDVWTTHRGLSRGRKERKTILRRLLGARPRPLLHALGWLLVFVLIHSLPILFWRHLGPMPTMGWWLLAAPLLYVVVSNYRLGRRTY